MALMREITSERSEASIIITLGDLDLDDNPITDAGLVHFSGLKKLELLSLYGTHVSSAGVDELQRALPNCRINSPPSP